MTAIASPRALARRGAEPAIVAIGGAALLVWFAVAALVAVALPYHSWDAFSFGAWSRGIADTGDLHAPGGFTVAYQRPLFYVLQGWLWRATGFHLWEGRLLSLAFSVLFVVAVALLARRVLRLGALGTTAAALAAVLIPDFAVNVAGGLSDVPAAAMVAAVAAAFHLAPRTRARPAALGVLAALAVLSKSTAIVAVLAFAGAELLGPRSALRERALRIVPVVVGALVGLAYFGYEAARADVGLLAFLRAGTEGPWAALADRTRGDALLRVDLLGADLRLPLWFALVYAALRLARVAHRRAGFVAAPAAVAASWLLPALATGGSWAGPFAGGLDVHAAVYAVLAALLPAAALATVVPSRLVLARLAVWAAPVLLLWVLHATYAARLASPSWPPLVLALAVVLTLVMSGLATVRPAAAALPITLLAVLVVASLPTIDALRGELWHRFWDAGPSGWTDAAQMRTLGLGALADELRVVEDQAGPDGIVRSSDERLRFWLGSRRVQTSLPHGCADVAPARVFVLLLDPSSAAAIEAAAPGASSTGYWDRCAGLVPVWQIPGSFAAYTLGAPRDRSPTACAVPPRPSGLTAVFGTGLARDDAERLRERATAVGFTAAQVEEAACGVYAVVLRGFTDRANAEDFAREARGAGFPVTLETLP
jgi:hypothetical protein